jgi:hypothetical protein
VNPALRFPILALARRVAAFGIEDGPPIRVASDRWRMLLGALVSQRLTGLATAALGAGRLQIAPEDAGVLLDRQRDAMLRALATERTLVELTDSFASKGVPSIVLKGPALAHTVYPAPEWRPFGDLDLLVRGTDWPIALRALEAMGFQRNVPEPRRGFDVRFGKAATHVNREGLEVDLHRTLVLGPFGLWIEPDALFGSTTELTLGGHSLMQLDNESLFLHACVHASLGWSPPLLLPTRDMAQIASSLPLDLAVVRDRMRAWKLGAVVEHAVQAMFSLVGRAGIEFDDLLLGVEPTSEERTALLAYTTARRRRGGMDRAMIRAIPGVGAKMAYLRDRIIPSREFLASRARQGDASRSYRQRWSIPFHWLRRTP